MSSPAISLPERPIQEPIHLDVASEADWQAEIASIIEQSGQLHALINNDAVDSYEPLDDLDLKASQQMRG